MVQILGQGAQRNVWEETEWAATIFKRAMRDSGARAGYTRNRAKKLTQRLSDAGNAELVRMASYIGRVFIGTIYGGRIAIIDFNDFRSKTGLPSLVSRTRTSGSQIDRSIHSDVAAFRSLYLTTHRGTGPIKGGSTKRALFPVTQSGVVSGAFGSVLDRAVARQFPPSRQDVFEHDLLYEYNPSVVKWKALSGNYLRYKTGGRGERGSRIFRGGSSAVANYFYGRSPRSPLKLKQYFLQKAGNRIIRYTGGIRVRLKPTSSAESAFYGTGKGARIPLVSVLGEVRVSFLPRIPPGIKNKLLAGDVIGPDFDLAVFPPTIAQKLTNDSLGILSLFGGGVGKQKTYRPLVQPILGWWLVHRVPYVLQQAVFAASLARRAAPKKTSTASASTKPPVRTSVSIPAGRVNQELALQRARIAEFRRIHENTRIVIRGGKRVRVKK